MGENRKSDFCKQFRFENRKEVDRKKMEIVFFFSYWVPLLNSNREIVSEKSDRTWLKFWFSIFPLAIRVRSSAPRNFSFWDTHRSEMVYPGRFRAWAIQDLPLTSQWIFEARPPEPWICFKSIKKWWVELISATIWSQMESLVPKTM